MISGVGPALIDRICMVDEFPSKGGHAVVRRVEKHAGGAAGNVVYGLGKFGIKARFFSVIGRDEDGKFYLKEMEKAGVECIFEVLDSETGRVDVYVDKSGERTFFVFPNSSEKFYPFLKDEHYKWGMYFYLDPFPSKNSLESHIVIAKNAKKHGKTVMLNPGYPYSKLGLKSIKELLEHTDIVFLSADEYRMLRGVEKLVHLTVITLGRKGSMAIVNGEKFHADSFETKVVDSTGAGDSFTAGFIYGMIKGYSIDVCLKLGNFTASYNIQRIGARNYPEKSVVEEFLKGYSKSSREEFVR